MRILVIAIRMDISLIYGRTFRFNEKCYAIIDFLPVPKMDFSVTKQNDLNGVGIWKLCIVAGSDVPRARFAAQFRDPYSSIQFV